MRVSASPARRRKRRSGAERGHLLLSGPFHPTNSRIGVLAAALLAADQASKWAALKFLSNVPTLPLITGVFHLTLVRNSGVAFGLFQGYGLWITLGTLIVLAGLFRTTLSPGRGPWVWVSLALVLGGAAGNLVDRMRFGGVVDFLDFRIWPVFNLADSFITVGAALLAVSFWRREG